MSVYNDAARLPTAVESIMRQTYRDWELIVFDDGSTDGTGGKLDQLAEREPRLRVVHQKNSGLTCALIRGCKMARGRYIARQDADDFSQAERLAQQAELLNCNGQVGFVSCWTQYVGPENEPLETLTRPGAPAEATRQLLQDRVGPPAHGSVMFRKSLYDRVGGYRPEFYFGQDSDLWLRMAERACIAYVPKVLYEARRDIQSVSGALRPLQRKFGELGQACRRRRNEGREEAELLVQARQLTERIVTERSNGGLNAGYGTEMAYVIGSRLARDGDRRAAKYLWNVIRHRPWHWRAWGRLLQASCSMKRSRFAPSPIALPEGAGAVDESVSAQPRSDRSKNG